MKINSPLLALLLLCSLSGEVAAWWQPPWSGTGDNRLNTVFDFNIGFSTQADTGYQYTQPYYRSLRVYPNLDSRLYSTPVANGSAIRTRAVQQAIRAQRELTQEPAFRQE